VIWPLIPARLHGWLDEAATATYLVFAWLLHGPAAGLAAFGAAVHFANTRLTNYPQGTVRVLPFRVHALIELGEGLARSRAACSSPATRCSGGPCC